MSNFSLWGALTSHVSFDVAIKTHRWDINSPSSGKNFETSQMKWLPTTIVTTHSWGFPQVLHLPRRLDKSHRRSYKGPGIKADAASHEKCFAQSRASVESASGRNPATFSASTHTLCNTYRWPSELQNCRSRERVSTEKASGQAR